MNALLQVDQWDVVLHGLHRVARRRAVPRFARFNPRPRGVMHAGSCTSAVLALMRSRPDRWWRQGDLAAALPDRALGAVSWSLTWLRRRGLVESRPTHETGCPDRFLTHRAVPTTGAEHDPA